MENKKYQVFISSTYIDLVEERKSVQDALLESNKYLPVGMETFLGADMPLPDWLKRLIDECDYYILIVAERYGTINEDMGISITEMEFNYARETGIPILTFFHQTNADLTDEIKKFRKSIQAKTTPTMWKNTDELCRRVINTLNKTPTPRPGWQRGNDYDEALHFQIMVLQAANEDLEDMLAEAEQKIASLRTPIDIEFETCEITIQYKHGYETNARALKLSELFEIFALEMTEKATTEESMTVVLKDQLAQKPLSGLLQFFDTQIVKKILVYLKHFKLVVQYQNEDDTMILWRLTPKGEDVLNELILKNEIYSSVANEQE